MTTQDLIAKLLNTLVESRLTLLEDRTKSEMEDLQTLVKGSESIKITISDVEEKLSSIASKAGEDDSPRKNILEKVDTLTKSGRKSRNVGSSGMLEANKTLKPNRTVANFGTGANKMSMTARTVDKSTDKREKSMGRKNPFKTLDEGPVKKDAPKTPRKTGSVKKNTTTNSTAPNTARTKAGKTPLKKKEEPKEMKKNLTMKNLNETAKKEAAKDPKMVKSKTKADLGSSKKSTQNIKKIKTDTNSNTNADLAEVGVDKLDKIEKSEKQDNSNHNSNPNTVNEFRVEEESNQKSVSENITTNNTIIEEKKEQEKEVHSEKKTPAPLVFKETIEYLSILDQDNKLEFAIKYLNKKDHIVSFPGSRIIGRCSLQILLEDSTKDLEEAESKLNAFKTKNNIETIPNDSFGPFVMTRGANRAVDLLNEGMYNKIFSPGSIPNDDVKLVYRIFFYFINKRDIAEIEDGNEFWKECSNYIMTEGNGKTGTLINSSVSKFDFSFKNLYRINKIVEKQANKIAPAYFSKICGTTGLFIFLIKDALEYAGIIYQDKKTPIARVVQNLNAFMEIEKEKVDRLRRLLEGVYKK